MRRGDGSLYDITVPGYKANLSDVLAAIALVQLDKLPEHTAAPAAPVRALRRGGRRPRRDRAARARPARHARAPPLRRPHRRRALRRDARRVPAGARRRADRDLDPLPARAPADLVPRALPRPAAAAGGGARRRRGALAAALAGALRRRHRGRDRGARARPRPRRMMSRPAPRRRDAARHRPRGRLPRLEDRRRARRSTSSRDASPWWFLLAVAIMIADGAADGLALAAAAGRAGDPRAPAVADARVLRLLHGRAGAADLGRRRRRADRRDVAPPPGAARRDLPRSCCSSGRSAARRRSCSARSASCSRSAATTSAPTSGSRASFVVGTIVLGVPLLLALGPAAARALTAPLLARAAARAAAARRLRGVHAYRDHPGLLVGALRAHARVQAVRVLAIWARREGGRDRALAARSTT